MSHLQHPRGPWDGLTPMPRRRRLPRSSLLVSPGADLRERLSYACGEALIAIVLSLLSFGVFLIWFSQGDTFLARALNAAVFPGLWLAVSLLMSASRALPFFHHSHPARICLVGLPAVLAIGGIYFLALGGS